MKEIDLVYRTMFAELGQRCMDAQFLRDFRIDAIDASFSMDGTFFKTTVKGSGYWYHQSATGDGARKKTYVGPVSDIDITRRVEEFARLKDDFRARRKLVATLIRDAGIAVPERMTGDTVEALGAAGFFRLRGVLVGTVAFQCYPGLLGVRLPSSIMQTGDARFAQSDAISSAVEDSIPPLLDVLRKVDPSFRDVPSQANSLRSTRFENGSRYTIEFLTPNTGSSDHDGQPAPMPSLGGASAQPLRFLDFLIHEPVHSVMLHRGGIAVRVPAPERYAVHKLVVASRRRGDGIGILKREKDIRQAELLMEALIQTRRRSELADAFVEAWKRGAAWRNALSKELTSLSDEVQTKIRVGIAAGMRDIGEDPAQFGIETSSSARSR